MALVRTKNRESYFGRMTVLKKLFWVYFLLLIFEGALRKWIIPQLSAPLLIVRDPVALMIIWEAYRTHKWPTRWSAPISLLTVLLVGLFVLQIIAGGNPLIMGLFGLRSFLLPFPVMFIMGENLDDEDLRKFGRCTLWLLLPMTLLLVAQYQSPSGSFINRGAYEGATQINFVGQHVRASGTFSFVVGPENFAIIAAAFIFFGIVTPGFATKWMLWVSTFALMLSIPMMGSRTVVVELAAMVGCVGLCALMGVSQFGRVLRVILPLAMVAFLVSLLPVFSDATSDLVQRFSGGARSEGGGSMTQALTYRTLQPALDAIEGAASASNWMGIGIGRGAVAVSALEYGTPEAVAGEQEFSREFVEMGPIAGAIFGLFKVFLAITILGDALTRARQQETLGLLLIPLVVGTLFWGYPEQPTIQGFMVIGAAFCIAAAKGPASVTDQIPLVLQRQQPLYRFRAQRR